MSAAAADGLTDAGYDAAVAGLFARRPEWMVPGLRRIRALIRHLAHPHRAYDALHITGTNGKTSTALMASALLRAHGRRVGTYTSPHLQDVRERILIDGRPIGRGELLRALEEVQPAIADIEHDLGEMVTFFEALTALGAVCFRTAGIDVGVIEVGMGGRWDATNVHDGAVAVLGPVGLDHRELGATIAEAAGEKAGIIKEGATVVMGRQHLDAVGMIAAEARARGARLLTMGASFDVLARFTGSAGQRVRLRVCERIFDLHLPLHGAHQAENAATALTAVDALLAEHGGVEPDLVCAAFESVRSPGRLEQFEQPGAAPVVLDGAHNPDGARALATALLETFPGRRVVALLGVLADKDVDGVVETLCEVAHEVVVTVSPCGRAAPVERLAEAVRRCGRPVEAVAAPSDALALARARAARDDVVVVTGSLYLVGAARTSLGGTLGRAGCLAPDRPVSWCG